MTNHPTPRRRTAATSSRPHRRASNHTRDNLVDPNRGVVRRNHHHQRWTQLRLFDIRAIPTRSDREAALATVSLTDAKAFSIDPDVHQRITAARSLMACDRDVQLTLAADPVEAVVLAFLDRHDPSVEANRLIIDGPHVRARLVLAGRRVSTATLELLAADSDPEVSARAERQLATRRNTVGAGR